MILFDFPKQRNQEDRGEKSGKLKESTIQYCLKITLLSSPAAIYHKCGPCNKG